MIWKGTVLIREENDVVVENYYEVTEFFAVTLAILTSLISEEVAMAPKA